MNLFFYDHTHDLISVRHAFFAGQADDFDLVQESLDSDDASPVCCGALIACEQSARENSAYCSMFPSPHSIMRKAAQQKHGFVVKQYSVHHT